MSNINNASGGGGGGTPGGNNKDVQYNNAGAFGGSDSFQFDTSHANAVSVSDTVTSAVFGGFPTQACIATNTNNNWLSRFAAYGNNGFSIVNLYTKTRGAGPDVQGAVGAGDNLVEWRTYASDGTNFRIVGRLLLNQDPNNPPGPGLCPTTWELDNQDTNGVNQTRLFITSSGQTQLINTDTAGAQNVIESVLQLKHQGGGLGVGAGVGVDFTIQTPNSGNTIGSEFACTMTDTTAAAERFTWSVKTAIGATLTQRMTIDSDGDVVYTPTWNNGATVFTGYTLNVTNTASAASSKLYDFQIGGNTIQRLLVGQDPFEWQLNSTSRASTAASIRITGNTDTFQYSQLVLTDQTGGFNGGGKEWAFSLRDTSFNFAVQGYTGASFIYPFSLQMDATNPDFRVHYRCGFGSSGTTVSPTIDVFLQRDAAGKLGQRNSTNAQTFRIYNTGDTGSSDPTNYERGVLDWTTTANVLTIGFQKGGTGTDRQIVIQASAITNPQVVVQGPGDGASTHRLAVNITGGATNVGFLMQEGGTKKWTMASFNNGHTNRDFTFFNEQTNKASLDINGDTDDVVCIAGVVTAVTTVSGLPAAGVKGRRRFVSDATATTFATIVAGTGANNVPVYDDGTNWRIG